MYNCLKNPYKHTFFILLSVILSKCVLIKLINKQRLNQLSSTNYSNAKINNILEEKPQYSATSVFSRFRNGKKFLIIQTKTQENPIPGLKTIAQYHKKRLKNHLFENRPISFNGEYYTPKLLSNKGTRGIVFHLKPSDPRKKPLIIKLIRKYVKCTLPIPIDAKKECEGEYKFHNVLMSVIPNYTIKATLVTFGDEPFLIKPLIENARAVHSILENNERLPNSFFFQIKNIFENLSNKLIIIKDLNLHNILITKNKNIQIIDGDISNEKAKNPKEAYKKNILDFCSRLGLTWFDVRFHNLVTNFLFGIDALKIFPKNISSDSYLQIKKIQAHLKNHPLYN